MAMAVELRATAAPSSPSPPPPPPQSPPVPSSAPRRSLQPFKKLRCALNNRRRGHGTTRETVDTHTRGTHRAFVWRTRDFFAVESYVRSQWDVPNAIIMTLLFYTDAASPAPAHCVFYSTAPTVSDFATSKEVTSATKPTGVAKDAVRSRT